MSRPRRSSTNPRRTWSSDEEQSLVQCLTSLVQMEVWQSDFGFRPGYLQVLRNKMADSYPESGITEIHIEGKIKTWKSTYCTIVHQILMHEGFSWDANEKKVLASNEVWTNYIQVSYNIFHI